ncbi:MAG: methyltransferase domain-containing protein [Patescibacteria group bacterium]|nr:class I SAM-dependent methyltransferase [Patescibacteria group bacterium]MBU1870756.1 class I SAM-dependent methyltransferase [Patescibacteria group bacterium]
MSIITGGGALIDANLILDKAHIIENVKVADLGCGVSGHFVFPTANRVGKKGIVYAVDILKTVLETIAKRAKIENYENVKTIWSNLEIFGATNIESVSLDVALLINTLYQSHKRVEIIREAVRLIKQGGILVIVDWKDIATPFGPPIEERANKELLKIIVNKTGMHLEEEFEAGQFHYGLIFVK